MFLCLGRNCLKFLVYVIPYIASQLKDKCRSMQLGIIVTPDNVWMTGGWISI